VRDNIKKRGAARFRNPNPRKGPAALEIDAEGAATFEAGAKLPVVDRAMRKQPWEILAPHLLKIGADPEQATALMQRYVKLLLQWNMGISNLISRNDEARVLERHVLEAVEPAHWLAATGARTWIDFGSGGGLPAIPLALVGVGERWSLVESRRTKTLFLRRVAQDLPVTNIEVVHARLEDHIEEHPDLRFDGFTSRATQRLVPTLELAAKIVAPGGHAFLWKGSRREEEMAEDESWKKLWEFNGLLGVGSGGTVIARFTRLP
jgi:16S rRNA (guanine527-N7)-methyltransferase